MRARATAAAPWSMRSCITSARVFGLFVINQGDLRPGIVHRLDRETSGVLAVARTDQAHQALAKQFHDRGGREDLSGARAWPDEAARRIALQARSRAIRFGGRG